MPDGGLTLSSLPTLDPYTRQAAGSVDSLDPRSVHLPRIWNWSLSAAKRLPWKQTLEVAYVGNRADRQPNLTISNYVAPGKLTGMLGNADLDSPLHRMALDASVVATLRNYPAYSEFSSWRQYEAVSAYHGLQATLVRSGTRVQYFLNYTFSKVMGTTGIGDGALIDPIDARNRSYGVVIGDLSYSLMIPDPIRSGGNAVLRGLLDGWQVSGITSYRSGLPFHVTFSGDIMREDVQRAWWGTDGHAPPIYNGGNAGAITPVFLGNPQLGNTGLGEKILDIDKIAIPALGQSGPFQSPYYLRTPSRWNFDLSVFKNFAMGGAKRLQLRIGFFNLFNQAAPLFFFGDIDLNLDTRCNVTVDGVPNGAGGTADGICDPSQGFHFTDLTKNNFGKIVTKRGHRVIELAVRFDF